MKHLLSAALAVTMLAACGQAQKAATTAAAQEPVGPVFQADSAYAYCQAQCSFGPRTMNSEAHERCGQWIAQRFQSMGLRVTEQRATLTGYDGTPLLSNNITASYRPDEPQRVMLCAHWDSRPWADNDPDTANWHRPVMAANDGASGVAVMLELARLLTLTDTLALGVDFVCFDAEDWGTPQWSDEPDDSRSWALGAQYWASWAAASGYRPRFGVLLDMVGGRGARFFQEGYSLQHAASVVSRVWQAAAVVGYSSFFPKQRGGWITDDHGPVNDMAGIPCIDIIPYYPDCEASSFGPTWHTVADDMQHIDPATLRAVGQTLVQVLYNVQ